MSKYRPRPSSIENQSGKINNSGKYMQMMAEQGAPIEQVAQALGASVDQISFVYNNYLQKAGNL